MQRLSGWLDEQASLVLARLDGDEPWDSGEVLDTLRRCADAMAEAGEALKRGEGKPGVHYVDAAKGEG